VPIALINLPVGYVAQLNEKEAVVTVQQQRGQPPVKPDEIKAVVDFAKAVMPARTAVENLPVQLISSKVVVQSLSPASLTVTIDKIQQKAFPLGLHYSGRADVVVSGLTEQPPVALVRGPASALARVAAVRLNVPLSVNPSFDAMLRPAAIDAKGAEVTGLQVSPNLIRVRAHFAPQSGAR